MSAEIVPTGKMVSKVPFQTGYVELVVPKIVFESDPEVLHIQWVDFFR